MPLFRSLALLAGFVLLAVGLALKPLAWSDATGTAMELALLACLSLGAGAITARILRLRLASAVLLTALALLGLAYAGPAGLLATTCVLLGGLAIGTLFGRTQDSDPLLRWVAGLGVLAACLGWLLPFPIHRAGLWLPALLALAWWRRGPIREDLAGLRANWSNSIGAAPWTALACALVVIISSTPAWLPVSNIDDLAYHVNLGWELMQFGHGRLDVGSQVWALAPWSTDLLHALVMLLAGREVTGPLNVFWLLAAVGLVQRLGRAMGLEDRQAWLAAMLYASLPMTSAMTGSLQVESATPAMIAALALAILSTTTFDARALRLVAALAGLLMGAKMSNGLMLLPFAIWLLWQWRGRLPWTGMPVAVASAAFIGGSSYAYAFALTGNPVLPAFNALFQSPWFPAVNFIDLRWQTGVPWNLPWRLVLDSKAYYEGANGCAGLVPLALLGGVFAGLADRRVRTPLVVGLSAALLVFWQVQYLRYFHPAMTLLLPALVAALLHGGSRRHWREWLLALLVVAQLWLLPTAAWMTQYGAFRRLVMKGPEAVINEFVPERAVAARFRATAASTDRLLYADRSHAGELPGLATSTAWFTPLVSEKLASRSADPAAWAEAVALTGANHVMTYRVTDHPGLQQYLLQAGATRIDGNGAAELYRLPPRPPSREISITADNNRVHAELAIARPHPVIGELVVNLSCDKPGEPISVSWHLTKRNGQPRDHWDWLNCGIDGKASARMRFASIARGGVLGFDASPVHPEKGMVLTLISTQADVRRNLHAETALYAWVWNKVCRRTGCGQDEVRLMPVP